MKKISYTIVGFMSVLLLTACSNLDKPTAKHSSDSRSEKVVSHKKNNVKHSELTMNVDQIQKGNYKSIVGDWKEVAVSVNHLDGKGSVWQAPSPEDSIAITADKVTNNSAQLVGSTMSDSENNSSNARFNMKNGHLNVVGTLGAHEYSIDFYPKNVSLDDMDGMKQGLPSTIDGTKEHITFWVGDQPYLQVYERQPKGSVNKDKSSSKMNLTQIQSDNYESLVGTWTNPADGKSMNITNKIMNRPAGLNISVNKGAIISGTEEDGVPEVIAKGDMTENGAMLGTIGRFQEGMSQMSPLLFIPKGTKAGSVDDSDMSKDRIILGGGQSGFADQAYYRN
ncbi:DUF6287 domain-containing protein [Companilactobacillus sp. DQM5]|uniref:DUF6287 domain-containing protein n=1 Tax=Companilactobacillus sp. DQM5 TaxID=3463359 RepID=UPI00405A1CDB